MRYPLWRLGFDLGGWLLTGYWMNNKGFLCFWRFYKETAIRRWYIELGLFILFWYLFTFCMLLFIGQWHPKGCFRFIHKFTSLIIFPCLIAEICFQTFLFETRKAKDVREYGQGPSKGISYLGSWRHILHLLDMLLGE